MQMTEIQRRAALVREEVMRLQTEENLTYAQIAERLNLTYNQVRAQIAYAKQRELKQQAREA